MQLELQSAVSDNEVAFIHDGEWVTNATRLYFQLENNLGNSISGSERILLLGLYSAGKIISDERINKYLKRKPDYFYRQEKENAVLELANMQSNNETEKLGLYKIFKTGVSVLPMLEPRKSYIIPTFAPTQLPINLKYEWYDAYMCTHTFVNYESDTLNRLLTNQQQSFLELFLNKEGNKVSYRQLLEVVYGNSTEFRLRRMKHDLEIWKKSRNRVRSIISKLRKRCDEVEISCDVKYSQTDDSYVLHDFSII